MNIQIFGTNKCFDTKKAQRYFKERGVRFQMIDLKEKGMSRGEFENVARALGGWEKLVDPAAGRILRLPNPKYPHDYLAARDKILSQKDEIVSFYGG